MTGAPLSHSSPIWSARKQTANIESNRIVADVKSNGTKSAVSIAPVAPPKKRGRPPKSAASTAAPGPDQPGEGTPVPAKRGRGRPRKDANATPTATKVAPVTAPASAGVVKRGRGRPRKDANASPAAAKVAPVAGAVKRGRGRPRKDATATPAATKVAPVTAPAPSAVTAKRGRGRPRKDANAVPAPVKVAPKVTATGKKRGRPAKEPPREDQPPKKRGRPSRASALADAVPPEGEQPPRKRGLPPYGGETTKNDAEDEIAAEQLEEELMDEANDVAVPATEPAKRGRGRPPGKGKQAGAAVVADATSTSGQQFWLMKAEQEGHDEILANGDVYNTKFTIDDLRAKTSPEPWDGVRNPTAAKNMRAMRTNDLAFFYASGGKPGIVGIMEIVGEAQPDPTASDKNSYGYVANEAQRSKWCVVHVEFRMKFKKPITRTQLVAARDSGPLANLQEFTAARLSVSKVSKDEWDYINSLVEGSDDDEAENGEKGQNEQTKTDTNGSSEAVGEEPKTESPSLSEGLLAEDGTPTTDAIVSTVDDLPTSV